MILEINDFDIFTNLYEIPLEVNPNYYFDVFIDDTDFKITIRTFMNNETRISIEVDNVLIVDNAPICFYQKNLNFYSDFKKGAFFFARNQTKTNEPNFNDFESNNLRLYYGSF